jgi:hypothetical protein
MTSPTSRSLAHLRKQDYLAEVVEKWNPHAHVRHDLYGIIDILCIAQDGREKGVIGIQATSYANHSSRRNKALASPNLPHWLKAHNRFFVHSWRKVKNRWQLREEELTLSHLQHV